ncbi:hypothetical protein SAMN03159338_1539 [Sphingomonas sp. NFR04]|uniref:hypothetical protein n=1 Tax=Sphingomonas sp. NFR04 TaxID=1566283 RepID=UPI0008DEB04E|nr:hypothetical protein [Sphingomonas sp. NFR04]SFJ48923.1 hypothetical protein SAMN03159338_1539 [Sphingomonas sp. NFR04]
MPTITTACDGSGLTFERINAILDSLPQPGDTLVITNPTLLKLWRGELRSSRMWVRMMRTGNYDRRKLKRMFRLLEQGN